MKTLSKAEFEMEKLGLFMEIKSGAVFIYPTDTIYGIGCDASNCEAVKKVRNIKSRFKKPFSVIAPSKKWIEENCIIGSIEQSWIDKLPGSYTLILKLKNSNCICKETNIGMDSIGVRIPDHWISKIVEEYGRPIITTSANHVGENYMTSLEDLEDEIAKRVKFVLYEGELKGRPSTIVDLTKTELDIVKR